MNKISVENACSFARSMDEELSDPEQFFLATSQWLKESQPVVAKISYEMSVRLCGEEAPAAAVQAVVGYVLRLLEHSEANHDLHCRWAGEQCPHVSFPLGEPEEGRRKYCCKRND